MNLQGRDSIMLKIGDLKLSDTNDTFGVKKHVNGISYEPLINPLGEWLSPVDSHLANGDVREGVKISDGNVEVYLTYGANSLNSKAQSIAIGFELENEFFFIIEYYRNIYERNPYVSLREIIRCESIYESWGIQKTVYSYLGSEYTSSLTEDDRLSVEELFSKVQLLGDAFSRENLNILRTSRV